MIQSSAEENQGSERVDRVTEDKQKETSVSRSRSLENHSTVHPAYLGGSQAEVGGAGRAVRSEQDSILSWCPRPLYLKLR